MIPLGVEVLCNIRLYSIDLLINSKEPISGTNILIYL